MNSISLPAGDSGEIDSSRPALCLLNEAKYSATGVKSADTGATTIRVLFPKRNIPLRRSIFTGCGMMESCSCPQSGKEKHMASKRVKTIILFMFYGL